MKRLIETHLKLTKLSDNYTYIILSSYTNFCIYRHFPNHNELDVARHVLYVKYTAHGS
jgi:hypothetical protein